MKEVEAWRKSEITCPYCNDEWSDSWDIDFGYNDDWQTFECEECGKNFTVCKNTEITYTSKGLCDENNKQHKWEYFNHNDGKCKGRKCVVCDKYEFDEGSLNGVGKQ
jgi:hypothetical protein